MQHLPRILVSLLLLAGCQGGPGPQPDPCPTTIPQPAANCDAASNGLQCNYPGTNGQTTRCTCSSGRWFCDSCQFQGGYPPISAYACTRSCRLDTSEWFITCTCYPNGMGTCCGSDTLNACPADPQPGTPCCPSNGRTGGFCPREVNGQTVTCTCGQDLLWTCPQS
ncbi:MAG TPA: hypothetical protein VH877_26340 [Polyangia bacterium]|nr:hypothetical protein [Polyangia bacterium]